MLTRILERYSQLDLSESIRDRIQWYLGDERDQIVTALDVVEVDMKQAFLHLIKLDPNLSRKYAKHIPRWEQLDKQARNIEIGKTLSSDDVQYLNFLSKVSVLTYIDIVFEHYTLLELKKDGALVVAEKREKLLHHPLCDQLEFRCTVYDFYTRIYKTSYYWNGELIIKGQYKGLPIGLRKLLVWFLKDKQDKVLETARRVYHIEFMRKYKDQVAKWYMFENGKVLDITGKLGDKCHPLAYTIWIFNPVITEIVKAGV